MKLRKTLKLFSAIAFLALGCCFSAFAAPKTFMIGGKSVAVYEFVDGKSRGSNIDTALVVHEHFEDPKQDDRLMKEFGSFIRHKCWLENIKLEVVETPHLIYEVTKDKDLKIQANAKGTDFTVRHWALQALNCIDDTTYQTTTMGAPTTQIVYVAGEYMLKKTTKTLTTGHTWGQCIRSVIIVDDKIVPRTYYDFRDQRGGEIRISPIGRAWSALFGIGGRCRCRKFVLNGREMHPRDIVKQLK